MYIKECTKVLKKIKIMLVKKNKLKNVVQAYARSGILGSKGVAEVLLERFRALSIYNNSGTCKVIVNGNNITIPVGVTITWDAPTEESVVNTFDRKVFEVDCTDCILAGTI